MNYIKDHIPKGNKRSGHKVNMQWVTVHNTGNPRSTARNERAWLTNPLNTSVTGWHVVVDDKEIIEAIPLDERAWHAGDGSRGPGNNTSIGVEICESGDQVQTWINATQTIAKLLHDRSWDVDRMTTHQRWSGKNCPRLILPRWKEFVNDTKKELLKLNGIKEPEKVIVTIPDWKRSGVDYLADNGLINDRIRWLKDIDEPIPVWAAMIIMGNIHKDLKGGK